MRRATCLFQVQRFREGNLRTWIGKMRYSTHSSSDHIRMGPAVRMLLLRNNLDADNIEASGPKGSLLKGDVLSFLENGGKGTTKEVQRVDLGSSKSNKKEDFSKDLSMEGHAKKSPHFYASVACNIKSLLTATQDAKAINPLVKEGDIITQGFIKSLKVGGFISSDDSIEVTFQNNGKLSSKLLSSAVTKSFLDIAKLTNEDTMNKESSQPIASVFRFEELGVDGFEVVSPHHSFSLVLGGVKQSLDIGEDGKPFVTQTIDLSLSCDARRVSYTEVGKILQRLQQYVECPYEMLTY